MKKNLYFRNVFRRENVLLRVLLDTFLSFCSYPRLMFEVFLRKNFGERYFTLASALTVAAILIIIPIAGNQLFSFLSPYGGRYGRQDSDFWSKYATWYLFLVAFLFFSFKRWQEVRRNPSVFDFGRFSLSTGESHPFFYTLNLFGKPNSRTIEVFYEPALFFIGGVLLAFFDQKLGWLWIIGSIFYSLGYAGAYRKSDNFVMDKIDEIICSEEMERAFVLDEDASKTRGVRFHSRKPSSEDLRRRVTETFIEDDRQDEIADVK